MSGAAEGGEFKTPGALEKIQMHHRLRKVFDGTATWTAVGKDFKGKNFDAWMKACREMGHTGPRTEEVVRMFLEAQMTRQELSEKTKEDIEFLRGGPYEDAEKNKRWSEVWNAFVRPLYDRNAPQNRAKLEKIERTLEIRSGAEVEGVEEGGESSVEFAGADDSSGEGVEGRESTEGDAVFKDEMETMLDKYIPLLKSGNWPEVIEKIRLMARASIEEIKNYLRTQLAEIRRKLGMGADATSWEASAEEAPIAPPTPENVTERRAEQTEADRVLLQLGTELNQAEAALAREIASEVITPEAGAGDPDAIAAFAGALRARAERIEALAEKRDAARDALAAHADAMQESEAGVVEAALENPGEDALDTDASSEDAPLVSEEEALELTAASLNHELGALQTEFNQKRARLLELSEKRRLKKKIGPDYNVHAYEADRDARKRLVNELNVLTARMSEIMKKLGAANGALDSMEDTSPEALREREAELEAALNLAETDPERAMALYAEILSQVASDRMDGLAPDAIPDDIERIMEGNLNGAAIAAVRERLDERRETEGSAERAAEVAPPSPEGSTPAEEFRLVMKDLVRKKKGFGKNLNKQYGENDYAAAAYAYRRQGGTTPAFLKMLLETAQAELKTEDGAIRYEEDRGVIKDITEMLYRDGVSDLVTITERLPQYLKEAGKLYKEEYDWIPAYLEKIGKKVKNVASYL